MPLSALRIDPDHIAKGNVLKKGHDFNLSRKPGKSRSHHGVDALIDLGDGIGTAKLADDLVGEFHRAAGGEAGDELAIDDDPLAVLDLSGGKPGVDGGMADDLLFRSQPAVSEQGRGRGAHGGDPLIAFALAREPVAHERIFGQVLRAFLAAGQHDDFKFARGIDVGEMDVGQMPGVAGRRDRIGDQPRDDRLDFGAAQDVDDGDRLDLLEAGSEENQRAHAVRGVRFGVILGRWVVEDETETVATAARIRLRRVINSSVRTTWAAMSCSQSTGTSIHDLQPSYSGEGAELVRKIDARDADDEQVESGFHAGPFLVVEAFAQNFLAPEMGVIQAGHLFPRGEINGSVTSAK